MVTYNQEILGSSPIMAMRWISGATLIKELSNWTSHGYQLQSFHFKTAEIMPLKTVGLAGHRVLRRQISTFKLIRSPPPSVLANPLGAITVRSFALAGAHRAGGPATATCGYDPNGRLCLLQLPPKAVFWSGVQHSFSPNSSIVMLCTSKLFYAHTLSTLSQRSSDCTLWKKARKEHLLICEFC